MSILNGMQEPHRQRCAGGKLNQPSSEVFYSWSKNLDKSPHGGSGWSTACTSVGGSLPTRLVQEMLAFSIRMAKRTVRQGDAVVVPAGTYHNVVNTSKTEMLKLYTIYSPPNHPDGTVHKTKAEAEAAELIEHS